TLTRYDAGGSFLTDGFKPGMKVWVTGVAGPFTISSAAGGLTATTMTLLGAALTPTLTGTLNAPQSLTVFGYDPAPAGRAGVGGDTIKVCNLANTATPCRGQSGTDKLAGPDSPLVVYGDTSQDGVWYSGHPSDVLGYEFGDKPFDPFTTLPDAQNEDDEWVFPLADPYDYAGNDVIDASGLFSWITCDATCSNLPTVGFTAYGGAGNDLTIGSQAGDHLAGGSGDDTILGERGADHIYGDSGVNVNVLTRALSIDTSNRSPSPTIDLNFIRFINNGSTIEPTPSPVA